MSRWHLGRADQGVDPSAQRDHNQDRYRAMRDVSLVGIIANVFLFSAKMIMGFVAQSQALIADGIHSLADALTDLAVIVTAKFSNVAADASHPYGHARIETAATAGLGVVLIVTGLGIVFDAASRLLDPSTLLQPTSLALWAAGLSIVINEGLYQYTRLIGRKVRSSLLIANAWHHRTDALSSVVVLIGVGGVLLGLEALDAIAAIGVALMIIHVGWGQLKASFVELVDSAESPERIEEIRKVIESIDGVSHPHRLRTRRMGEHVLVDVHVEVPVNISVSEGHQLAETVQFALKAQLEDISDVIVHIDPKGQDQVWLELPARAEVEAMLKAQWASTLGSQALASIGNLNLHYLNGAIDVEVVWVLSTDGVGTQPPKALAELADALKAPAQALAPVRSIVVYFELG